MTFLCKHSKLNKTVDSKHFITLLQIRIHIRKRCRTLKSLKIKRNAIIYSDTKKIYQSTIIFEYITKNSAFDKEP